jgi:hypothetical protein
MLKSLYWCLLDTARSNGVGVDRPFGFFVWLFSRDRFAEAARSGLRDYVLRRFGRLQDQRLEALTNQ